MGNLILSHTTRPLSTDHHYASLTHQPPLTTYNDNKSSSIKIHSQQPTSDTLKSQYPDDDATDLINTSNDQHIKPKIQLACLKDYVCNTFTYALNHSSSDTFYPLSNFMTCSQLSLMNSHFVMSLNSIIEPKSFTEENKYEWWKQAMLTDIAALKRTSIWDIVDLSPNIKPMGCRWIYKIKFHTDGIIERFKSRLIAKDYSQFEGLN